ncbi:MAG: hypothetical protein AAFP19_05890 [Bacteroidota bacterium]
MLYRLLFCGLISIACLACGPKNVQPLQTPDVPVQRQSQFPDDWMGEWEGELVIYRGNKELQRIPMQMSISPGDTLGRLEWSTTYSGEKEVIKPYALTTIDSEKGWYLTDENNSIYIESYLFNQNKLVSWYEVQGSLIMASHELRDGQMIFEIFAGKTEPVSITGNTKMGEEDIPEVKTFPMTIYQKGILQKKK